MVLNYSFPYATRLAPFVSLHLSTLVYMSMHESLCVFVLSIFQSHGTMDTQSKPTFFLLGHPLLFDNMLVYPFVCLTCLFAPIWLSLLVCPFSCFLSSCFFACLVACFLCHCMYTLGARMLGARARFPRCKLKGQGCKEEDSNPKREIFSRLGGLASPSGFSRTMY